MREADRGHVKLRATLLWFLLLQVSLPGTVAAVLQPDAPAQGFSLSDLQGRTVEVGSLGGRQLLVLLFFDIESRPSLDCLQRVNELARQHPSQLAVYGISSSPPEAIRSYLAKHNITIPVLRDNSKVRGLYDARQILPVGCLIGRDFRVLSYYQGGGGGFKRAIIDRCGRDLRAVTRVASRPAPAENRTTPAQKRTVQVKAAAPRAGRAVPRPAEAAKLPTPAAEEKGQHRNVGKLLNDNEW